MKELLKNVFALLFGLIVAGLLGEVGARLYVFGWDALDYQKLNSVDLFLRSEWVKESNVHGLAYELRPNLAGYHKLVPFSTNYHGMRDQPCDMAPSKHTNRVAIIGDSFTMGSGVSHEKLFHTIVENRLNTLSDTLTYELLNFGVGGYGLPEYLAVLKQKVVKFRPSRVVIGFCGYNDHTIPDSMNQHSLASIGTKAQGFNACYLKQLIRLIFFETNDAQGIRYSEDELNYIENNLKRVRDFAALNEIEVSLIYLCNLHKKKEAAQLKNITERLGMKFIDTSYRFANTRLSDYSINILDAHPNEEANLIFSEELFRLLEPI